MLTSGIFSGTIALLLAAFLGFLAAWIWRGKRMSFLESQASRLRRDRRALAHRISQANARLDSANFKRAESDEATEALRAAHEKLEADHARLVANYANLKQGIVGLADDDDWFEGLDDEASADGNADARDAALRELEAFEDQLSSASDALAREVGTGADSSGAVAPPDQFQHPATPSDIQDEDQDASPWPTAGDSPPHSEQVISAADKAAMREQLESQQAEIARLQEQMAPLIGLPLAVAAREAERDRLAARLQVRDQEVSDLQASLERLGEREASLQRELSSLRIDAPLDAPANVPADEPDDAPADAPTETDGTADQSMLNESLPPAPVVKKKKKKKDRRNKTMNLSVADRSKLRKGTAQDVSLQRVESGDSGVRNAARTVQTRPAASKSPPRQFDEAPESIDNLKEIKGIGPVLERRLNQLGIFQFRQIAAWSEEDIAYFDEHLTDFRGRIRRDDWVQGASLAYERKYG